MLGSGQSLAFESVTPFWPVAVAPYQTADYNRSCCPIQAPLTNQSAFPRRMAMRTAAPRRGPTPQPLSCRVMLLTECGEGIFVLAPIDMMNVERPRAASEPSERALVLKH